MTAIVLIGDSIPSGTPSTMADGIHRSDVGRADLAANLRDVLIAEGIW